MFFNAKLADRALPLQLLFALFFELMSNSINVPEADSKILVAFGKLKHFAFKFQD